jgi:hypothetical protein
MSLLHINAALWLLLAILWTTKDWPNVLVKCLLSMWGAYLFARSLV